MKQFIYWLMGETVGGTIVAVWNWLWGIPVEDGDKVAVVVAEESLQAMQAAVQKLAEAVSVQQGAYKRAKTKYEAKVEEIRQLEAQARIAQQQGNDTLARLSMTRLLQSEQILPQLEMMVQQAEQAVSVSRDKLERERLKLESFKTDMQNIKDMAEVNEALMAIAQVNREFDLASAQQQFETARNAIENRNLRTNALVELSEDSTKRLELDQMAIAAEVTKRLQQFQVLNTPDSKSMFQNEDTEMGARPKQPSPPDPWLLGH